MAAIIVRAATTGRALTVGGPGSADGTVLSIRGACRVPSSVTAETLRCWKAHVSVMRLTIRGRQIDGYIHHLTYMRLVLPRAVETVRRKGSLLCDNHKLLAKDDAEAQCFFSFLIGHWDQHFLHPFCSKLTFLLRSIPVPTLTVSLPACLW